MISYYIIPNNVYYVQFYKEIKTWVKTDCIDYNTPTVAVIDDSTVSKFVRFVVIYKGLMQTQGGSGSCYNPTIPTFLDRKDPMDNSIMPQYMSKWMPYSYTYLLKLVIAEKHRLLKLMGIKLPFWYWDMEGYDTLQGELIAKLDAIGMNRLDSSCIKEINIRKLPKALTC